MFFYSFDILTYIFVPLTFPKKRGWNVGVYGVKTAQNWSFFLKGSYHKRFSIAKPHILESNGVWYTSFWLEGPKNHLKLKILVSKFVPWDLEATRIWNLEATLCGRIPLNMFIEVAFQTEPGFYKIRVIQDLVDLFANTFDLSFNRY